MADKLTELARYTVIVADTGDIAQIKAVGAQDCTTNPSLILKAASKPEYAALMDDAVAYAITRENKPEARLELALDKLAVNFGTELSHIVPGYVSTEVDAHLSFNTAATIKRAERLIALYREAGVDPMRILIKIAATWEGVRAASVLKEKGIATNLTLIFSKAQAALCGEAGVFLISPFVGRITDWYKAHGAVITPAEDDPGVRAVHEIYDYFRAFGYRTIVMGASFRNIDQILGLAGCDRLTIGPALLEELRNMDGEVVRQLGARPPSSRIERLALDEASFRWQLNENAMATEKLAEGIRSFAKTPRRYAACSAPNWRPRWSQHNDRARLVAAGQRISLRWMYLAKPPGRFIGRTILLRRANINNGRAFDLSKTLAATRCRIAALARICADPVGQITKKYQFWAQLDVASPSSSAKLFQSEKAGDYSSLRWDPREASIRSHNW